MKVPNWLQRLMATWPLASTKIGPEDRIGMEFAADIRQAVYEGRFRGTFTHIPNEVGGGNGKKSSARYALAKSMGLITGVADYVFARPGVCIWIEFKAGRNVQSPAQQDFQTWCEQEAVPYYVVKSAADGIAILRNHGFVR